MIAALVVGYLVARMVWRMCKPDPMRGRLVPRSGPLHGLIVVAHRAEHDKVASGAWCVNLGPHMTVEEPSANRNARRGARALAMYMRQSPEMST